MAGTVIIEYLKKDQRNPILPFGLHCIISEALRGGSRIDIVPAPDELHRLLKSFAGEGRGISPDALDNVVKEGALSAFFQRIADLAPNVIGFASYEDYINMVELLIRVLRPSTDAYFVIGGPLPTMLGEKSLQLVSADFAFMGESELLFSRFLSSIGNSRPSLRRAEDYREEFRTFSSMAIRNVPRDSSEHEVSYLEEKDLEEFELDFEYAISYLDETFGDYKDNPILSYISSRGCPYGCIFCSGTLGKRFRKVSANKLTSDLVKIRDIARKRFKSREKFIISFGDDNFLLDRDRAVSFFKLLERESLNRFFQFTFQASVNTFFRDLKGCILDTELTEHLVRANVRFLTFGTDNFCDEELRRLNKAKYSKRHIYALVEHLEERGLYNNHFCILSNLYTKADHIKDNLESIIDLDSRYRRFIQLRPITYMAPYYGTTAWREVTRSPEFFRMNAESLPLLFDNAASGGIPLAGKVLPLDPLVRRIIYHLEHNIETKHVKSIPYYYDFTSALEAVMTMKAVG